MPLEFALRPQFDLDRPVRRRRTVRSRFLRFAVPTAAYWLAIAGATYAFVTTVGGHSPSRDNEAASALEAARVVEPIASPPPTFAPIPQGPEADSTSEPAPLPPPEPAPPPVPASEPVPGPALAARPPFEPQVPSPALPAPPASVRAEPQAPRVAASPPAPRLAAPDPFAMPDPFGMLEPLARNHSPVAARSGPVGEHRERVASAASTESHDRAQNEARAASLPSCESARASAGETIEMGAAPGAPDLTRDAFASVLEDGSYLNQCAIPARTALDICAAVQNGKVVGLTVTSEPRSPTINACVRRAVTALRFPHSSRLDVTRTRFAPSR